MEFFLGFLIGGGLGILAMSVLVVGKVKEAEYEVSEMRIQAARYEKGLWDRERYIAYGDQDGQES